MSRTNPGAVIHKNVAIIACDTSVTLQETMKRIADLAVDAVAIGDRHLALPARDVRLLLDRLNEHGQFPRLVGELPADGDGVEDAGESN